MQSNVRLKQQLPNELPNMIFLIKSFRKTALFTISNPSGNYQEWKINLEQT